LFDPVQGLGFNECKYADVRGRTARLATSTRSCSFLRSLLFVTFVCMQERDVVEGADMLMVKPGMTYLDVARQVKEKVCFLNL